MTDEDDTIEAGTADIAGERLPTPPLGATRRLGGATAGMALGTIFTLLVIPAIYVLIAKQHNHDDVEA